MRKIVVLVFVCVLGHYADAQLAPLTVEKIMRDPKWIGTSPSNIYWTPEGNKLLFNWNPEKATSDSLYYVVVSAQVQPQKAKQYDVAEQLDAGSVQYNKDKSAYTFVLNGDIYLKKVLDKKPLQLTQTEAMESNPTFSSDGEKVRYFRDKIAYELDLTNGSTRQLYTIENKSNPPATPPQQEQWLQRDAIANSEVLQFRKQKRESAQKTDSNYAPKPLPNINTGDKSLMALSLSPDGRWVTYVLVERAKDNKRTIVPDYVTESGYTTDIPGRPKVGEKPNKYSLFVLDLQTDSVKEISTKDLPGIKDQPDFVRDYPNKHFFDGVRTVSFSGMSWSPEGKNAVVNIYSDDNKDRWIAVVHPETASLETIDRQRDEAWIAGPGIRDDWNFWGRNSSDYWIDENTYWFQSEASGYSHLYSFNISNKTKKQLTNGNFEIQDAWLSNDKKSFYFISNEIHPGEKQLYKMSVNGGNRERLTFETGAHEVSISPDEKYIAYRYSYSNKPWELFIQENKKGAKPQQITHLAQSDEFKSYAWREPVVTTFTARDGAKVYARIYPAAGKDSLHPAVVFVHGAGYLQNAHKWWSDYFHEYMFNNLLADNGYTVIDMDYRGSAGYGRNWRTGIYRHMGGKDLTDNVDGVQYLIENYHVDPKRVGLYGGSYGGFITLMAMFKEADVFKAGAALRSVVNWANYNHGYTSDILNEPFNDSLAYHNSSPIYFANGLKGHLLMCHGMIDTNVNFQDIVQLSQKLIELGKNDWELAVFPKEDHGFVEPSSWTDEYKRIFKLFQTQLK